MIKFTGQELLDAMEKNGYELTRDWVQKDGGRIVGACIMGQALLNMDIPINRFIPAFTKSVSNKHYGVISDIIAYNDEEASHTHPDGDEGDCIITHHTYPEILAFAKQRVNPEEVFEFEA